MLFAYFILIGYSLLGVIYYPNIYTLVAFTFIAISCFPFFIAGIYGYDRRPYKIEYPRISKYLLFSGFLIGIFNLYIITKNAGYELHEIFSISGIKAISVASTEIRYNGGSNVNSGSPIILAISLFFVFIAGLKRKENNTINIIVLFVPIILYTVLTTEKWPTFLGIMFCFCGCCCSFSYKEIKVVVIKNIKYLLVVFSLMVVSLYLRSGGQQSVFTSITSLFNYVLSPYYGFGYWLVNIHNNFNLGLGYYTFIGPLSYFSSITGVFRDSGVFDENYYVYGNVSNIYTAFRYIVQDFSIYGALILNLIITFFYCFSVNKKHFALSEIIKMVIIIAALLSLNVTIFVHNSVFLAIVMCCLYIIIYRFKIGNKDEY